MVNAHEKQLKKDVFSLVEEGCSVELKAGEAADSPRLFEMLAYTGAIVTRWFGRLVFELSGIKFSQTTPILKDHDDKQIVGQSEKVSLSREGIRLSGFMLKSTEAAKEITRLSDEKYKWQASPRLEVLKVEFLAEGHTSTVNEKEVSGPLYIVRESKMREASFVPVGADGDTSAEVLSFYEEVSRMSGETKKTEGTDVLAVERKRCADLKAAYPKDEKFALLAIEKGWNLQEAKAEYADVLAKRNEELSAQNATLSADLAKSKPGTGSEKLGPDPIGAGGSKEGGAGEKSFIQLSDEYRAQKNCSVQEAMSYTARTNPSAHAKYVAECRSMNSREIERSASK